MKTPSRGTVSVTLMVSSWLLLVFGLPMGVLAGQEQQQELERLRRQVEAQQKVLSEQAEVLRCQQEELERQMQELAGLAETLKDLSGAGAPIALAGQPQSEPARAGRERDAVGDLNAAAVAVGDFPGSIQIPGTDRVSLAVGGFVKSVAIADSDLEGAGPIFLPAAIGSAVPDQDGNVSLDATLSRLNLDARARTANGSLGAYFEWDLNASNQGTPGFNLRHAYGSWESPHGTLTLGHTWSTLMDLQILPEGMTEPTVSGAIFQRQAQLRWTHPFSEGFRLDLALEDPSNRDVISGEPVATPTRIPDIVAATQWDWPGRGHFRMAGILRRLRFEDVAANAWAVTTGAHWNVLERDKVGLTASYGKGVGRYLLGVPGSFGGFVDPSDGELRLIEGWGGMVTYRHAWSGTIRSTFAVGRASIGLVEAAPEDVYRRSFFGLANFMVSPLPYLTYGFEYQYGARENMGGQELDNHRLIFGVQVF